MSRSALRPALGTAAALAALILAAPSALATTAPDRGDDAAVSFAVFGDTSLVDGQELSVAELTRDHHVDANLLRAYGQGTAPDDSEASDDPESPDVEAPDVEAPTAAAPTVQAGDPAYALVASWTSKDHRTVNLRRGNASWGLTKIEQKHNLNVAAVRTTTKYPAPGFPVKQAEPDSWNYVTKVLHVRCSGWLWWRTCKVVEFLNVTVTVNYGNAKGVITAYCLGVADRCPDWVKNAANAA
ncbi:hypothetical protein F7Q99_25180 [Streptomyces kaniharaensis]|uniref:Secreted protein n=1 Tax=Streptomyces kaniharaensis TaxID=212423 RepID=A0A6N7KV09_9ACTN|nr:hypothetical protein [Streptomyces kaniharaensis]MQS15472.1 hypothetical protein [Streptomyces kaniharaensis]